MSVNDRFCFYNQGSLRMTRKRGVCRMRKGKNSVSRCLGYPKKKSLMIDAVPPSLNLKFSFQLIAMTVLGMGKGWALFSDSGAINQWEVLSLPEQ